MNRRLRRLAPSIALVVLAGPLLSACGGDQGKDAARQLVLTAFTKTLTQPYTFSDTDADLEHTAVVSGTIADAYRHSVLLQIDGKPQWEEIVRDDAVADYFPSPDAVATYSGNGASNYTDATGVKGGNTPPDTTVTPAVVPGASPAASPGGVTTVVAGAEVPDESSGAAVLTALKTGQWVVDPDGAPAPASQSTSAVGLRENPFYESLLSLATAKGLVSGAPKGSVVRYQKDNLFPAFKPADDPFPVPGAGVQRYDLTEQPVPGVPIGALVPAPLDPTNVMKVAVYIRNGLVVQVREVFDPTDRLQTIASLYKVNLPGNLSTLQEEQAGERIVNALQATSATPYRVHSETLTLSFIGNPSPVSLPASYVRGPLNLLPLHGAKVPAPTPS